MVGLRYGVDGQWHNNILAVYIQGSITGDIALNEVDAVRDTLEANNTVGRGHSIHGWYGVVLSDEMDVVVDQRLADAVVVDTQGVAAHIHKALCQGNLPHTRPS